MTFSSPTPPVADDNDTAMRTELKVLGVLALLLLAVEGGLTLSEDRLSADVHHLRSIPSLTSRIRNREESPAVAMQRLSKRSAAQWDSDATQVLFLTSAQQVDQFDLATFQRDLEQQGNRPVELIALHPAKARISEWSYLYRNFVSDRDRAPDLLVIGFEERDLRDAPTAAPSELARFYDCRLDDLNPLSRDDLRSVEDWSEFMLSNASATFTHRRRVEQQLLATLIPGYATSREQIHSAAKPPIPDSPVAPEYQRLQELTALAQRDHVEVVLVALPSRNQAPLDPQLIQIAQQSQFTLMDCRRPTADTPAALSHYLATWLPLQTLLERHDRRLIPAGAQDTTRWASGDRSPLR